MKIKFAVSTVLGIAVATTALTGCGGNSGTIRFGAAGIGGSYHEFADLYSDIVRTSDDEYNIDVRTTAGSVANVRLLSEGYVQLAVVQSDILNNAYNAEGYFEHIRYRGYSAVASLYTEACQIVVRTDSGINNIYDLNGKTISIGEDESGTEQNAEQILAASGLMSKNINTVHKNYTEAAEDLKNGNIDAFFCTAGAETTVIEELAKQCNIKLLSIDDTVKTNLKTAYSSYKDCTIPAGTYTGQTEPVNTVGVNAVLVASNNLSASTVKKMTETLYGKKEELQYTLSFDMTLDESKYSEGVTIPFHDGAIEYYESKGITVNLSNN